MHNGAFYVLSALLILATLVYISIGNFRAIDSVADHDERARTECAKSLAATSAAKILVLFLLLGLEDWALSPYSQNLFTALLWWLKIGALFGGVAGFVVSVGALLGSASARRMKILSSTALLLVFFAASFINTMSVMAVDIFEGDAMPPGYKRRPVDQSKARLPRAPLAQPRASQASPLPGGKAATSEKN